MTRPLAFGLALLLLAALGARPAAAQPDGYDPSWYDPDRPHVELAVVEDGVYRVTGEALQAAGVDLSSIAHDEIRLIENGREIPLDYEDGSADANMQPGDAFAFVARRNRGRDEAWAYRGDPTLQSSTHRSLFTDTTHYWMTWDGPPGRRYEAGGGDPITPAVTAVRDTAHLEQDVRYYLGTPGEDGSPFYTRGEGYYWTAFNHTSGPDEISRTYTLPLDQIAASGEAVAFEVQFNSETASCHRVRLEAALLDEGGGGSPTFEVLDETEWLRYDFATLGATVAPERVSAGGTVQVRLTSFDTFENSDIPLCADGFSDGKPNTVLLDWIEGRYTRRLAPDASGAALSFTAPAAQETTFELSGYGSALRVYNATDGRRFNVAGGDPARFTDDPSAGAVYWAAPETALRPPARIQPDAPSSLADLSNSADYILLTTEALRPSAEALQAYREANDGYAVALVTVQDVYDQFDYGRATPLAIRRFVYQAQAWSGVPRFLGIWGDAAFPIRTENAPPDVPWNVPAFGYAPSDGWYAMQYEGPNDFAEVLAVGRVPVRTNAQGQTFLGKLQTYERAPLSTWQKRSLLLSGGTSDSEQNRLQAYSQEWGDVMAMPPTGADTLYFSKQTTDATDFAFQDSLSAAFERGAGWLNYFGHSGAQTWEIVTDKPSEFDNAGRLPFVVSLGCQTGAFAGGINSVRSLPSFGEQLVLGLDRADPEGPGSPNGSITHYGTSSFGSIRPSATINDALIDAVFQDTVRTVGEATRRAEARVAAEFFRSSIYVDHLLQYGLLGDPATRLTLPDQPDLALAPAQLAITPLQPVPSDSLRLAVRLENQGLVPADSVTLAVTQQTPGGQRLAETRRLAPFALDTTLTFATFLTEQQVGPNTFTATADPDDALAEAVETNNEAAREQIVFSSGLELVTPRARQYVTERQPLLRATLASAAAGDAQPAVDLELAADPAFDELLGSTRIAEAGLRIDWQPPQPLTAGRTYHWRARLDAPDAEPSAWRSASFTVRPDLAQPGWLAQGAQFAEQTADGQLEYADGAWRFGSYALRYLASSERGSGSLKGQFNVGGSQRYEILKLGFGVLIVDGQTGTVRASGSLCTYAVITDELRQNNCTGGVDGPAAVALLDSLVSTLEEGDYLFTRTRHLGQAGDPTIPAAVRDAFRTLGGSDGPYSAAADTLSYGDLWTMRARKGFPEETAECVHPPGGPLQGAAGCERLSTQEIQYVERLPFRFAVGQTTTPRIGPARAWQTLAWTQRTPDASDVLHVDVLTPEGAVLRENLDAGAQPVDLSGLDARQHPYLRLRATFTDSTNRTAPQLERWRVAYTEVAELAVDARRLALTGDTLREGGTVEVAVPVVHLSETPADSVRVRFAVTDAENETRPVATDTLRALSGGAEAVARAAFATDGLLGANVLSVRAAQPGRPEPVPSNNTVVRSFRIGSDREPPAVRVTVGGRALPADFDPVNDLRAKRLPFVPAQPSIEVEVDDDNAFDPIDRADLIDVYFDCDPESGLPCDAETDTTFTAGTAEQPARVTYAPDLALADSLDNQTHTLYVAVEDAAGNTTPGEGSDRIAYQVSFRVSDGVQVRDLYPYPNPMSTQTEFAFRLQGSDPSVIEAFRLRIYTLAGRLLREFDLMENECLVNPARGCGLQADWNRIPWNGTDADGDRLATGVYLYKVFAKSTDGTIRVNDDGVEKIAIIR